MKVKDTDRSFRHESSFLWPLDDSHRFETVSPGRFINFAAEIKFIKFISIEVLDLTVYEIDF